MSKITDLLVSESEKYLSALMAENIPEHLVFHDYPHALKVKQHAETIGRHDGLAEVELNLLRIAALFYYSGFFKSYADHMEESSRIASHFLEQQGVDAATTKRVCEIIRSVQAPEGPSDPLAGILGDASLMLFTGDGGLEQLDLLYEETSLMQPGSEKRSAFERRYLEMLEKYEFRSEYGKTVLQPARETVIRRINARMKRRKAMEVKKEPVARKKFEYSRGVDTMFRITARNQINLNSIADNKSNILISVNAIIISIIITMLAGNIGNMSQDILPILVLLLICLVTIIIAILSTRPNIVTNRFSKEDVANKKVDLTFFGNFIKLDYDEYLNAMREMMPDDENLYAMLIRNQYNLGKILSKKFRLIRIAYNVFMIGIIFTVIVFLLNYWITH